MKKILLLLALTLGLSACLDPQEFSTEELQALVDAELEKKIHNYRQVKLERCQKELEARANFIVDSLLFVQTQQQADSLFADDKKQKPRRPEMRKIPDQRPVAPLFDTILVDSLPEKSLDSLNIH